MPLVESVETVYFNLILENPPPVWLEVEMKKGHKSWWFIFSFQPWGTGNRTLDSYCNALHSPSSPLLWSSYNFLISLWWQKHQLFPSFQSKRSGWETSVCRKEWDLCVSLVLGRHKQRLCGLFTLVAAAFDFKAGKVLVLLPIKELEQQLASKNLWGFVCMCVCEFVCTSVREVSCLLKRARNKQKWKLKLKGKWTPF